MTKYHENLLRDSPLSLLSTVKILFFLETHNILKIPNETFLRITRYKYHRIQEYLEYLCRGYVSPPVGQSMTPLHQWCVAPLFVGALDQRMAGIDP